MLQSVLALLVHANIPNTNAPITATAGMVCLVCSVFYLLLVVLVILCSTCSSRLALCVQVFTINVAQCGCCSMCCLIGVCTICVMRCLISYVLFSVLIIMCLLFCVAQSHVLFNYVAQCAHHYCCSMCLLFYVLLNMLDKCCSICSISYVLLSVLVINAAQCVCYSMCCSIKSRVTRGCMHGWMGGLCEMFSA